MDFLSAVNAAGYSYRYVNLLTDIPAYHKAWGVGGGGMGVGGVTW